MKRLPKGRKSRVAVVLGVLLLALGAAPSAPADCFLETPAAYRRMGGASRLGPYATRAEAEGVNRDYFQGRGTVSCDRTPPPPARGYGSVILHNAAGRSVTFQLRNAPNAAWNTRTVASGSWRYDYQPQPAAFVVAFDASDLAGYQEKRYNLAANHTAGVPGAGDARAYSFVDVEGGIDLVTGKRARPTTPPTPPLQAPSDSDPPEAWERRRGQALGLIADAQADLIELQQTELDEARLRSQAIALGRAAVREERVGRRLARELEIVEGLVATWGGAADALEGARGPSLERADALRTGFEERLMSLREAGIVRARTPREPPSDTAIGLPVGPLPRLASPASEAIAAGPPELEEGLSDVPAVAVPFRTPIAPLPPWAVTREMLANFRATRDRVCVDLEEARRSRDHAASEALETRIRIQDLTRANDLTESSVREGRGGLQRLRARVAEEILETYVAEAQAAFTEAALGRLARLLPPDVVATGRAVGEAVQGEIERFEAWFSAAERIRLYARTMLAEAEPGGLVERIGTGIRASMIVHVAPAEAERARRALDRRWWSFAEEVQDLGIPDEASRWVDVLRTYHSEEGEPPAGP